MQKCEDKRHSRRRRGGQSIRPLLRCRRGPTTNVRMRPVLLVVLDGWGNSASREGNAILLQGTPNLDKLAERFPVSQLHTSGLAVGLPEGQMGNSEVGHTNLGAGRVVYQDLVCINRAIESGAFFYDEAMRRDKHDGRGGEGHLLGLVSDG